MHLKNKLDRKSEINDITAIRQLKLNSKVQSTLQRSDYNNITYNYNTTKFNTVKVRKEIYNNHTSGSVENNTIKGIHSIEKQKLRRENNNLGKNKTKDDHKIINKFWNRLRPNHQGNKNKANERTTSIFNSKNKHKDNLLRFGKKKEQNYTEDKIPTVQTDITLLRNQTQSLVIIYL